MTPAVVFEDYLSCCLCVYLCVHVQGCARAKMSPSGFGERGRRRCGEGQTLGEHDLAVHAVSSGEGGVKGGAGRQRGRLP